MGNAQPHSGGRRTDSDTRGAVCVFSPFPLLLPCFPSLSARNTKLNVKAEFQLLSLPLSRSPSTPLAGYRLGYWIPGTAKA